MCTSPSPADRCRCCLPYKSAAAGPHANQSPAHFRTLPTTDAKMKLIVCLSLCVALAVAVEITPKTTERLIVADVLRDFPGFCYASTQCRTFQEGQQWDLKPFCGQSKCVKGPDGRLMEKVQDCGPLAKETPDCKISPKTNTSLPFPDCCPIYDCKAGAKLEFPELPKLPAA